MSISMDTKTSLPNLQQRSDQEPIGLEVRNHWNRKRLVVLEIEGEDGSMVVTVRGDLLKRAVDNAMNRPIV